MEKGLVELLKGEKLNQMLLKFAPLCFFNIRNLIISLKHCPNNSSSFDYILKLKTLSGYAYIQGNLFSWSTSKAKSLFVENVCRWGCL
jgi:hypothetical protein